MPIFSVLLRAPIYRATIFPYVKTFSILIFIATLAFRIAAVTIPGTNTGAIPDGGTPNPTCGPPRDINFAVTGAATPVASVSVSFTATHSFIGDLDVMLIAPDSTAFTLFSYVGRTPPMGANFGDSSNLNGTYTFSDVSTGNIWAAAAAGGNGFNLPGGGYRSQTPGPYTNINPGPPFSLLNSAFVGVPNANGDWKLRFLDCAAQDTGTVSAATLTLLGPTAAGVTLGGRVISPNGRGLSRVSVSLGGGDIGQARTAVTNPFGYFFFNDIPAGLTYVVTVSSRRYVFTNPTQIVNLNQDFSELRFFSEP